MGEWPSMGDVFVVQLESDSLAGEVIVVILLIPTPPDYGHILLLDNTKLTNWLFN